MSRKPIIFESDHRMVLRQQRLNRFLRLGVLLLVVAAMALTSIYFYIFLTQEEQAARNRLRTFAELRASAVQRQLDAYRQETALWAAQEDMQNQAKRFMTLWHEMTPRERAAIRRMLSPARQDPREGDTLQHAVRSDAINAFLTLYREKLSGMQAFLEHHGYANLHFLTPQGNLVFSVHPRADFGQNMSINGSIYAGRSLGQAFQRALRLVSPGNVVFEDFALYPTARDTPRAFFAAPMLEMEGEKIGVLAIELDISSINRILNIGDALGRDGLVYAVGPDLLLRNDLPNRATSTALRLKMDTPAVRGALDGKLVTTTWKQNNERRIAVALPMDFDMLRWAVVTEMPLDEMRAPYRPYALLWGASLLLIMLLGAVQYWLLRRSH